MYTNSDHNVVHNRRKLTIECSASRASPQRDPSKSVSGCSDLVAVTVAIDVITRECKGGVSIEESGYKKNRSRHPTLSRSGMSLCPYLFIIFLLAGTPSVVRAQAQNETTMAPSVSLTVAVPDPTPSPTTAPAPTDSPSIPIPAPPFVETTTSPTSPPTSSPTNSTMPTVAASDSPSFSPTVSFAPTGIPSAAPTGQPSWSVASIKETKFRQEFQVGNGREFTDDELSLFQTIYKRYTVDFSPLPTTEVEAKIETTCTVDKQTFLIEVGDRRLQYDTSYSSADLLRRRERRLQDAPNNPNVKTLNVDYTMRYESFYYNVTNYPKLFQNWTTNNLNVVLEQMQFLRINVTQVNIPKRIVVSTPAPSISLVPSISPTIYPTISPGPSVVSTSDLAATTSDLPTDSETQTSSSLNIIIISVSMIIAFSIIAFGLYVYYKKRRANRHDGLGTSTTKMSQSREGSGTHSSMRWAGSSRAAPKPPYGTSETKAYGSSYGRHSDAPARLGDAVSSPPGSLVSSQSLISRGNSMGGDSREEEDTAHILVDEFDQYKDQNLEKMRADIQDLPECDGMMSQAVAKALIDQDDESIVSGSYWGGGQDLSAPEIEASALGFVLDWLKRNGKVSDREK